MEVEISTGERVKELTAKKKKVLASIKRAKRALVKSRLEKNKIDDEIKKLRAKGNAFAGMTPEAARARVIDEMDSVAPEHIYPRDLEREFDNIDKPHGRAVNEKEVLDLAPDDTDGGIVGDDERDEREVVHAGVRAPAEEPANEEEDDDEEDQVIDLSDQ